MTATTTNDSLLADVTDAAQAVKDADAELAAAIRVAHAAGRTITSIADAAAASRPTIYRRLDAKAALTPCWQSIPAREIRAGDGIRWRDRLYIVTAASAGNVAIAHDDTQDEVEISMDPDRLTQIFR